MLYLATASTPEVRAAMRAGLLGQMIQPKAGNRLEPGVWFAIDNGCVRLEHGRPVTDPGWDPHSWQALLERHTGNPLCLFATVPDVVADAQGTDERWSKWAPVVIDRGYRPAYVLQNGCQTVPCDAGAVFTGGDTAYKLSPQARRHIRQAQNGGLWCHMGRVNSLRRLRRCADDGYQSCDGTYLTFGPDRNLPTLLGWLHPTQPSLWGGVA